MGKKGRGKEMHFTLEEVSDLYKKERRRKLEELGLLSIGD